MFETFTVETSGAKRGIGIISNDQNPPFMSGRRLMKPPSVMQQPPKRDATFLTGHDQRSMGTKFFDIIEHHDALPS
jgi:hypothetical protein